VFFILQFKTLIERGGGKGPCETRQPVILLRCQFLQNYCKIRE
jgi:hypothetical protein